MLFLLLLFAAQVPSEMVVRVEVLGTDPCDLASRIPPVLAETLRGVRVVREEAERLPPAPQRMRLVAVAGERSVRVELFDDKERSVLAREVPNPSDACPGTADGIALIVERYLKDLGYEPSPLPPLRVETSTPAAPRAEPPAPVVATRIAPADETPSPWAVEVGMRGIGSLPIGASNQTSGGGAVLARIAYRFLEVSLEGAALAWKTESVFRTGQVEPAGTLWRRPEYGLLGVGACASVSVVRGCVAAKGGLESWRAKLRDVPMPKESAVGSWIGALELRADVPVFWRLWASLAVSGLVRPQPESFVLKTEMTAFDAAPVALTIGLGFWVRL